MAHPGDISWSQQKSICICLANHQTAAKAQLQGYWFQYWAGSCYVGGFLGSEEDRDNWLTPKIHVWIERICQLAKAARNYLQVAYAGLTKLF